MQVLAFFREKELNLSTEEELRNWWNNYRPTSDFSEQSGRIFEKINSRIESGRRNRYPWWRAAAVFLLIIGAGLIFNWYHGSQKVPVATVEWVTKQAPMGVKLHFELPDGSMVHLNSQGEIKYIKDFSERRVLLEGEAYFDVAKDAERPFSVECRGTTTTALGTSFNIFSQQEKVVISLASGKVKVDLGWADASPVFLTPGEQVSLDAAALTAEISHFDLYSTIAWKEGILLFDEDNLQEVVSKLQRWFGVEIETIGVQNINSSAWQYSGEFDNESLENVLEGIGYVKGFQYKISGKNVSLYFD